MNWDWAADYIGIPYIPYGRSKAGLDCWGLVRLIYEEQKGIALDELENCYDFSNNRKQMAGSINTAFGEQVKEWKLVFAPRPFDVAAFTMYGMVYHVGIVLDERLMIHVEDKKGVCLETYKRKDFHGFYRYL